MQKIRQLFTRSHDARKVIKNSRVTRRASYLSDMTKTNITDGIKGDTINQDVARPRSTARRNASPADCGAESLAKVPAFMAANTFTGFVSFCAGPGPAAIDCGSGGIGGGVPKGDCPKPGLNPVGSARTKMVIQHKRKYAGTRKVQYTDGVVVGQRSRSGMIRGEEARVARRRRMATRHRSQ